METLICLPRMWEFPIGEFLVLARENVAGLYVLNGSARFIWETLKSGVAFAGLVQEFASAYDIPQELARQDIARTLDEWHCGLLSQVLTPVVHRVGAEVAARPSADFFVRDYLVHGKSVRLILQTSELAEEIAPRLESLPHPVSTSEFTFRVVDDADGFRIFRDGCCIATESGIGEIRGLLLQEIVLSCRERDCLAVFHAGACGSNSRCVIFPASTQAGKTTLAAVLMNKGWTFYADDSVLLERDTLSVPVMPFSLTVREGSWDLLFPRFPELQQAPVASRYGQRVRFLTPAGMNHDCSGQAAAMVFVRFDREGTNEISSLDTLQTLIRLQESGFWVAHDEQSIRSFLEWLQATPCFSLCYSDVDQAAAIIGDLV